MSENPWRRDKTVFDFLQIRAANSAGMHADQNFAFGNLRHGNMFHRNMGWAAIYGGAHLSAHLPSSCLSISEFAVC